MNNYELKLNEARSIACDIIAEGYTYEEIATNMGKSVCQVQSLMLMLRRNCLPLFTKMRHAAQYRESIKFANRILRNELTEGEIHAKSFKRKLHRIYDYDKKLYVVVKAKIVNQKKA